MLSIFLHNLDPVAVSIGSLSIKWYGVAYVLGILLCSYLIGMIDRHLGKKILSKKIVDHIMLYITIGVVVGGRFGYVIFYHPEWIFTDFTMIFKPWMGGMSFHGGLIGVGVALFRVSKMHGISHYYLYDIASCAAPIGIFFGRIANFINGELFGRETSMPWGVIFANMDNVSRHPSQLYEAFFEGLVLFLIMIMLYMKSERIRFEGRITGAFVILYSIARICCEVFRMPDSHLGFVALGMTMGQILSIVMCFVGVLIFFRKYIRD